MESSFQDDPFGVLLERPGLLVVLALLRVVAGKDTVQVAGHLEVLVHQEGGVGVEADVVAVVEVVFENVVDHPAEKGDVRAGPDGSVDVRHRGGPGEAGVDADQRGTLLLGLGDPLEGDGVVLGSVAAVDHDDIRVLDVDPVVRHRASSKRLCQSRYGGAVSYSSLMLDIDEPQASHPFLQDVTLFIVEGGAADVSDSVASVDLLTLGVLGHERLVPRFLDPLGDFLEGPVPLDLLPLAGSGGAVLRLQFPRRVVGQLDE